jgi:hypothetical protein
VSDSGHIVLDVRIATEKLVSPAPDDDSGKQKDDHGETESHTQRRNALLFNHRYQQRTVRYHEKRVPACSTRCYDASVGFSVATGGQIASISSEGDVTAATSRSGGFQAADLINGDLEIAAP